MEKEKIRCSWVSNDQLYIDYHDHEWGVPVFDDSKLFEFLVLESMQSGLSWITILKKRENFRAAFSDFNAAKVAGFTNKNISQLMNNAGIIRNEKKILAAIKNAQSFLGIQEKFGSFSSFSWDFVNNYPVINNSPDKKELPAQTILSQKFSKELKSHGFSFIGPVVAYSHMQAVGMINDHRKLCFRRQEIITGYPQKP